MLDLSLTELITLTNYLHLSEVHFINFKMDLILSHSIVVKIKLETVGKFPSYFEWHIAGSS